MDTNPSKLRDLASWYREFAERAGNPVIWESRLRTAQDLEAEADQIDRRTSDCQIAEKAVEGRVRTISQAERYSP